MRREWVATPLGILPVPVARGRTRTHTVAHGRTRSHTVAHGRTRDNGAGEGLTDFARVIDSGKKCVLIREAIIDICGNQGMGSNKV
jgi:hypothetical protein